MRQFRSLGIARSVRCLPVVLCGEPPRQSKRERHLVDRVVSALFGGFFQAFVDVWRGEANAHFSLLTFVQGFACTIFAGKAFDAGYTKHLLVGGSLLFAARCVVRPFSIHDRS